MTNRMREPRIGLFFEVDPLPGHSDRYFELASVLRPELEKNPGLIFIDCYKSIDRPNIVLSHSWWESEETLIAWRQHTQHRATQRASSEQHFQDYRLRIGRLVASSEETAPTRSGIVNLAARGMLVVSVARRLGSEGSLPAYCAAQL